MSYFCTGHHKAPYSDIDPNMFSKFGFSENIADFAAFSKNVAVFTVFLTREI